MEEIGKAVAAAFIIYFAGATAASLLTPTSPAARVAVQGGGALGGLYLTTVLGFVKLG